MQDVSAHTPSPFHASLIFFGILCAGCVIQITLWQYFPIADQNYWAVDAAALARGVELNPSNITYIHPGTTILYPMAALISYGVEPGTAVRLVMAAFAAFCIALAALCAYYVWPLSLMWLSIALILMPDLRLLHATPPSTAASLIMVVFVLLFLYAHEKRETRNPNPLIALGACAGILLATRIDTGFFVLVTAAPFLFFIFQKRAWILLGTALGTFIACNPHLWVHPITHLGSIWHQIFTNKGIEGRKIFGEFLLTFPFAILSLGASLVLIRRNIQTGENDQRVPISVYTWLLGATLLFTAFLAPLSYHPTRYFMPFFLVWDILLPLWLPTLVRHYFPNRPPWLTERRVEWIVIGCIGLLIPIRLSLLYFADTREVIF